MAQYGFTKNDKVLTIPNGVWHAGSIAETRDTIGVDDVAEVFDFTLTTRPTYTEVDGQFIQVDNKRTIVRQGGVDRKGNDMPAIPLSIMSASYGLVDPADHFGGLAETFTDLGCEIAFVGTLAAGARSYMSVLLPHGCSVLPLAGGEEARSLVHLGDSTNGSTSSRATQTFERIRCLNALNSTLFGIGNKRNGSIWSVPHTLNAGVRLAEAAGLVELAIINAKAMTDMAEKLANTAFVEAEFQALVKGLMGDRPTDEGRSQTVYDNKFQAITARYHAEDVQGVTGTKWHAMQSLHGYSAHVRGVRGAGEQATLARTARSIGENIFGQSDAFLTKAIDRLVMA